MAIEMQCISVVLTKTVIATKYPGGLAQYEIDCPNRTFLQHTYLTRVGFMDPQGVGDFIGRLQVAAQEQRQHFGGIHALTARLGEVARPVDVDDARDFGRLLGIAAVALEFFDTPVTPRNCAQWPPAEPPVTPIRVGSILYFAALARVQRTAAFTS